MSKEEFKILAEELHRPARKAYPTRKVVVPEKDHTWGMDLADMSTWKDENDGVTYILTVIDVFTRWADAKPVKTKSAKDVLSAFIEVVKDRGTHPKFLWIDQGKEFLNKDFKAYCKKFNVKMYHTYGQGKSVMVERFNRTLKTMMWKELTAMNSHEWVSILPDLINRYNNKKHSSIGMTPNEASSGKLQPLPEKKEDKEKKEVKWITDDMLKKYDTKFKIGDWVRISRIKGTFEKGYDQNWSHEIFKIDKVLYTQPTTYKLVDYNGEEIKGSFYNEELQKTRLRDIFFVEKVLKTKVVDGVKWEYVKWLGYDKKDNSWIKATD